MFFEHIYDETLAQGSFLIGCQATGEAIVIDAKRDVDTYLQLAEKNKLNITHLAETHIHADFLAGTRELAKLTGAKMYLSDEGGEEWQYAFDHEGLKDGDKIKVGNLTIEAIHTPGHTPEHMTFLVTDHPSSDVPVLAVTGDFVFVGDIGRPDLLEKAAGMVGTQEKGAEQMYHSLEDFKKQNDFLQIWPGHGAGSACGKALGAVASTTLGYEKIRNWAFQFEGKKDEFKEELLSGQPEAPKYFAMMKKLNKVDRPLLTEVPKLKKLTADELSQALKEGLFVADTRDKTAFAKKNITGTVNLQNNKSFNTWAGWLIGYDKPFALIADEDNVEELTRKLMRIGLDNILGYVPFEEVTALADGTAETIDLEEMEKLSKKEDVQVVDVRGENEYSKGHIEGADNVFVGTLPDNLGKIDRSKEVVVHCQSGDRASIAQSLLAKAGIKAKSYSGGMKEWQEEGKPVVK